MSVVFECHKEPDFVSCLSSGFPCVAGNVCRVRVSQGARFGVCLDSLLRCHSQVLLLPGVGGVEEVLERTVCQNTVQGSFGKSYTENTNKLASFVRNSTLNRK